MTAGGGPEALDAVRRTEPDLLLTDVNMPQMSGDELARQLRQTRPGLKVLYLTGFSDQLFRDKTTLWKVSLIIVGRIGPVARRPTPRS